MCSMHPAASNRLEHSDSAIFTAWRSSVSSAFGSATGGASASGTVSAGAVAAASSRTMGATTEGRATRTPSSTPPPKHAIARRMAVRVCIVASLPVGGAGRIRTPHCVLSYDQPDAAFLSLGTSSISVVARHVHVCSVPARIPCGEKKKGVNMTLIPRLTVAALALAVSAPAFAQSFNAEIDCGGIFSPGDKVPFKVRLEEQALQVHNVNVTVELDPQGLGTKTVFHKVFVLNPNQDLVIKKNVGLPANAPLGSYELRVIADDGSLVLADSCSFNVN